LYPSALYIGIADGAHDDWEFLERHTTKQTFDFYHATEYLTTISESIFSLSIEMKNWLDDRCHQLKHTVGAAKNILDEMIDFKNKDLNDKHHESIEAAITYFQNNINKSRMNYSESVSNNHVIGSGVREAACKTIVKRRLCKSGMRWKETGAATMRKVNQYKFLIAA
jgi:PTN/MK heparin-binding protein family, N-terminal domain